MEISDDGSGEVMPRAGGVGLASMRRRAEAVGGLLHLRAVPGVGTTVTATLPAGGAMNPVRVVLADDHPMYRYGVSAVLADEPRVELVGQGAAGTRRRDQS